MTKADLITKIALSSGYDKRTVSLIVEGVMGEIKQSLTAGESVYLRGFGSFILKTRAEKTARNITKGTSLIIPEHSIPAFKPAKTFMSAVK